LGIAHALSMGVYPVVNALANLPLSCESCRCPCSDSGGPVKLGITHDHVLRGVSLINGYAGVSALGEKSGRICVRDGT